MARALVIAEQLRDSARVPGFGTPKESSQWASGCSIACPGRQARIQGSLIVGRLNQGR